MQHYRTPPGGSMTDISLRPPRISAGAAIALVWLIVGVGFWVDPTVIQRSLVGTATEPWAHIWNGFYVLGGTAVLAGRWHHHNVLGAEILGICLLAAGWLMNAIAVWSIQGVDLRSLTYLVWIWWAFTRYRSLEGRA